MTNAPEHLRAFVINHSSNLLDSILDRELAVVFCLSKRFFEKRLLKALEVVGYAKYCT
jgi:hypothetical protein